jgi:two-component system response regulator FixJ
MSPSYLISIIEHDDSLRFAMASLLQSIGYRVTSYESACKFLNSGDIGRTNCIIVDVLPPGVDGIELKHHLDKLSSRSPVIIVTAHQGGEYPDRAFATRAFFRLEKPFEAEVLIDRINRVLAVQRALISS